jgi:heptosyltransferase III
MTLKKPRKILVIIQRSNGDVFLSLSLINILYKHFNFPKIDLLVNDDTISVAKIFPNINFIHKFSYKEKHENRLNQEKEIISNIFRKYDLCINLTASDRSVFYCLLASKNSISAIEKNDRKSWWKKLLLTSFYYFDNDKHILYNNLESLNILDISHKPFQECPVLSDEIIQKVKNKLNVLKISKFVIFHPSAQYDYKIYPDYQRERLLRLLNNLDLSILVTGSNNKIDLGIKEKIPDLKNVFNFIGETSLEEYFALSQLSLAYIGMDTLNMHIAAAQNKRVFAIYGPTNLKMWAPWSNKSKSASKENMPLQTYENITIFQAGLPCVPCGKAGCDDKHGRSECLHVIDPEKIFNQVNLWSKNA